MSVRLWLEALEPNGIFAVLGAGKQDGYIFAEFGTETKVDQRVVEAGRFGEEPGEDTGQVRHMKTTGRPHGDHCIWGPGQDEGCANHNGNLKKEQEKVLPIFEDSVPDETDKNSQLLRLSQSSSDGLSGLRQQRGHCLSSPC